MTSRVKGQGRDVTWCVSQVLAQKSKTQSPRNTENGRKVTYFRGNIAHLFQGQKFKGQGRHRETESCHVVKTYEVWFLHAGGDIPCRPNQAATQLVRCLVLIVYIEYVSDAVSVGYAVNLLCIFVFCLCL